MQVMQFNAMANESQETEMQCTQSFKDIILNYTLQMQTEFRCNGHEMWQQLQQTEAIIASVVTLNSVIS